MQLSDMTDTEKRALGSLVRVIVGVDGEYSSEESAGLEQAAEELGAADFWQLVDAAGRERHSKDAVRAQARTVERPEARETIYGVLFNLAAEGSIVREEGALLDWLAETWDLETAARS